LTTRWCSGNAQQPQIAEHAPAVPSVHHLNLALLYVAHNVLQLCVSCGASPTRRSMCPVLRGLLGLATLSGAVLALQRHYH
jgi:hypothetical protein